MDIQHMLDNASTACQVKCISEHPVVIGAILRSIHQWIDANEDGDIDFLKFQLKQHRDFNT